MYSQVQYEVFLTPSDVSATTSGTKAEWAPGLVPHIIRGFSMSLATGVTNPVSVKLLHISLASGSTASDIATINTTTGDLAGIVVYKQNLNVEVTPGQKVILNVPAIVSGAANFRASIMVEPRWERPANNTVMRATT